MPLSSAPTPADENIRVQASLLKEKTTKPFAGPAKMPVQVAAGQEASPLLRAGKQKK